MRKVKLPKFSFAIAWIVALGAVAWLAERPTGLAVYALLAAIVGLKRSYLLRPGDGRSQIGALAFAGALGFGPIGGLMAGALGGLGRSTSAISFRAGVLPMFVTSGVAGGLATGLVFNAVGGRHASGPLGIVLALLASLACFTALVVAGSFERRRYKLPFVKTHSSIPVPEPQEFAAGIALACAVYYLKMSPIVGHVLTLMPAAYLARQIITEVVFEHSVSKSGFPQRNWELNLELVQALVSAINIRDQFPRNHTSMVVDLALNLARRMGISPSEIENLQTAALLHDIGKLLVPEHILLKPSELDESQLESVKHHPEIAQRILEHVHLPLDVYFIIRSHHERWDGTGYPDGLSGEEIPIGARVLAVADVYLAMLAKRSYRSEKNSEEAIAYVRQAAGAHFDPAVVSAFEQLVAEGKLPTAKEAEIQGDTSTECLEVSATAGDPLQGVTRESKEFIAMFEIAQAAYVSLNLEEVVYLLAHKVRDIVPCSSCIVFVRNTKTGRMEVQAALGLNAQSFRSACTTKEWETFISVCFVEGNPALFTGPDIQEAVPFHWASMNLLPNTEFHSAIVVPLMSGKNLIGIIALYDVKPGAFSKEESALMSAVAPQISTAIQNALIFKQTSESALTDALTGLHNYRYLFARVERELNRARRLGLSLSVLEIDLDNFKMINDSFGHQYGDTVLREVACLFQSEVREYDLVCRYGGDEFIIVLPETSKQEALETAHRISKAVDNHPPYRDGDTFIPISVSIGVATFPDDARDTQGLIARADLNMYAVKRRKKQEAAA